MSHSPGPWYVDPNPDDWDYIRSDEYEVIAEVYHEDHSRSSVHAFPYRDGEARANARLIAAAPKLLAACKAVLAWAYTPDNDADGGFDTFAEDVIPQVAEAVAETEPAP